MTYRGDVWTLDMLIFGLGVLFVYGLLFRGAFFAMSLAKVVGRHNKFLFHVWPFFALAVCYALGLLIGAMFYKGRFDAFLQIPYAILLFLAVYLAIFDRKSEFWGSADQ